MPNDAHSTSTRQRIIAAACKAFTDYGYEHTTIRQIVALAGTNIASINYHFGSKEALYHAVVDTVIADHMAVFRRALQDYDIAAGTPERIRAFARERMLHNLGARSYHPPRLFGWELIAPSADPGNLFERHLTEIGPRLTALVAPLFVDGAEPQQKALAVHWFFTAIMPPPPVAEALHQLLGPEPDPAALDAAVARLVDAAIVGVAALTAPAGTAPSR